ncbi:MAG TPA: MotA/TolQ/ExbB proton channel family protein [Sphingomonas sp.]|jgi:biopolymer transport protein ExbB|uniref:MotA/TolQ/ExbB proton channel family protein n=1 Tax=Sphingomonas sp. TaxID=28214 RepID=UPI002ED9AE17
MATPTAAAAENQFGLMAALQQGGVIAWTVFIILVIMSAASWYILFTKLFEQQKILNQAKRVRTSFWGTPSIREGAGKLEKNSAYRQIADDGLRAQDEHTKLTDPVDQHEWLGSSLGRSQASINSKLGNGLAVLATVGSTSPFIGLFGTVIGIYRALIKIGAAGQASIDAVAGPVGEALIMTALGLAVAVPAVLAYNWLIRRNKVIAEQLGAFATDLHGYMVSNGALKPALVSARTAPPVTPTKTGTATITKA